MKKAFVLLILSISLAICLTACDWQLAFGWLIDCDEPIDHTHKFGEWSVTERPTSTKEGLQERICSCGERESETIAKLPAGYSVGLDYKLNEDGQSYSVSGIGDCTDRILVISPVYNELPVTKIDNGAFYGRKNLTRVVIPDSVVSIGDFAFNYCISLTDIEIPDGVTSIGRNAFDYCRGLTKIVIPDSVVSIGSSAFYECKYIRDVYISDLDVWCNIPFGNQYSSPMYYGADLHLNGELVTEPVIPDNVTSIGAAFCGCTSIVSVTIPSGVKSIEKQAFSGCKNISEVYISDMDAWYDISFGDYSSNPLCYGADLYLNGELVSELVIPDTVTSIRSLVFYGCASLTRVVIPDSVTHIGDYAFSDCTGLASIVIPDSVTSIDHGAFADCDSLAYNEYDNAYYLGNDLNPYLVLVKAKDTSITSCEIHPDTRFIHSWAFYDCEALMSVVIPGGIVSIGAYSFADCDALADVYYAGTEEEWKKIDRPYNYNDILNRIAIHYSYAP